jgi:acetyl-CoA decarbonylase/synthase complex subunit gamma
MALSGLDIYKLLPKTNCKECGFPTCLAFAMQLAQKKIALEKCPHVQPEAKAALESAAEPPMKLVTIGTGDGALKIGNETVMFRHEQKFYNPAGIGFLVEDTLTKDEAAAKIAEINSLRFERVGQVLKVDLVAIENSSKERGKFLEFVNLAMNSTALNLILISGDADTLREAARLAKSRRPLLMTGVKGMNEPLSVIAKEEGLPMVVEGESLEEVGQATAAAKAKGVNEMVLAFQGASLTDRIQKFTLARRSALKKNARPLGYPLIAFTSAAGKSDSELEEAVSYVTRYANIVIVKNTSRSFVLPLLVARQDIYTDPQKPVQVEPKIYEIGKVSDSSPVLVTTNFSITYFTVAGEVEASKVPSYIISCDSEGMSVLTAWAAEKFTAETIAKTLQTCGIADKVSHKKAAIPGYVSVLSGHLEELSGWKIQVGPREASGIPAFLKGWKC